MESSRYVHVYRAEFDFRQKSSQPSFFGLIPTFSLMKDDTGRKHGIVFVQHLASAALHRWQLFDSFLAPLPQSNP